MERDDEEDEDDGSGRCGTKAKVLLITIAATAPMIPIFILFAGGAGHGEAVTLKWCGVYRCGDVVASSRRSVVVGCRVVDRARRRRRRRAGR